MNGQTYRKVSFDFGK